MIFGARMNTAWNGSGPSGPTSRSASKLSTCLPKALRSTVMSMSPASGWGWPGTSVAMKIAPAQVPHTGMPAAARSLSLGMIP